MSSFINDQFLLQNQTAQRLYHQQAKNLPIIDYHNHLSPQAIAEDQQFNNITQMWLEGDHYKWRAMRANGIKEKYITGNADNLSKFKKWAATVPNTLRNPLYHWTHLELKRYFEIDQLLNEQSAERIYNICNEKLKSKDLSVRSLLKKWRVEVICTTNDPTDNLEFHRNISHDDFEVKVLPTFRPDKILAIEQCKPFIDYLKSLSDAANLDISHFNELINALQNRVDYFHQQGGRLADHGLIRFYSEDFTEKKVELILGKALNNQVVSNEEADIFRSALLLHLGQMYAAKGWTQQFHVGAFRNTNARMFKILGPDSGFDSIGDHILGLDMAKFFSRLDESDGLAKTIVYNLNPRDNALFATMMGNFNDGSVPGKMQYGASWWYLDQKEGIEQQLNDLSNFGLLARFVGMLTDSRSFMSFPRHEYFRRVLCNLVGRDVENGLLPDDQEMLATLINNICYYNAKMYFDF